MLRERVGGSITISNITEDLQISHKPPKSCIELTQKLYIAFSIYPMTKNVPRSTQKLLIVYFYDNVDVTNEFDLIIFSDKLLIYDSPLS